MRSCDLIFSLLALLATAHATAPVNISEIISEIPSCALACIINGLTSSPICTIADPTCLCANQTLRSDLSSCVQDSCTQAELIPLAVANDQLCAGFPIESRGSKVVTIGSVFIPITLLMVFLRCWSRRSIAKELWWDDWSILFSALILIGILITDIIDVNMGFGRHLWEIQATNVIPLLKMFLLSEVLYLLVITSTKVSILLFYLRVFRRPVFCTVVMITIGLVIASEIAFILVVIFQCSPISGAWDKTSSPECINVNALSFSNSGVSIAQDFVVLFLPVSELASLQMSFKKKLNVLGMFSIGGFACVTSMIRLKYIVTFGDSKDVTWDNVTPAMWSIAEICVAMICACLPAVRALLNYWFPSIFEMSSYMASNSRTRNSAQLESETNWTTRNAREVEEGIMMSHTLPDKAGGPIAKFDDLDDIPPSTRPKTPASSSEYSEWHSKGRRSDEEQFLEVEPATPLTNGPENHVST